MTPREPDRRDPLARLLQRSRPAPTPQDAARVIAGALARIEQRRARDRLPAWLLSWRTGFAGLALAGVLLGLLLPLGPEPTDSQQAQILSDELEADLL